MRLNPDCIRDILLTVEEKYHPYEPLVYPNDFKVPRLSNYSEIEIEYHFSQCSQSNLIRFVKPTTDDWFIGDLTPQGHSFLANIRSDTTWNKTKEISKKVGSSSLDSLKQIATNIVTEIIKSQL